jgi:hypothetical protein
MSIRDDNWFEVWFVEGGDMAPAYLLIVKPDKIRRGYVVVYDPHKDFQIIHEGHNYEDTRLWLQEDEFSLVQGREFPDDEYQ